MDFQPLLSKQIDRKGFLAVIGGVFLSVIGLSGLLRTLENHGLSNNGKTGYGRSRYSGNRKLGVVSRRLS